MDEIASRTSDLEIDLENGMKISTEDPIKESFPGVKMQVKKLLAKISNVLADETVKEGVNLNGVSPEQEKENNADRGVKEKRKSMSNKKAPKPPRPPRGPSLDSADQKLIKEIAEIAMLKRARIERMKALKKLKGAKATSSSNSNVFAMVFTVLFFLVILYQGMSSSVNSVNLQGSGFPISAETPESGLIAVQFFGNPSDAGSNEPNSGPASANSVKSIIGFDPPENRRRAAG